MEQVLKAWLEMGNSINDPVCRKLNGNPEKTYNVLSMAVATDSLNLVKWLVSQNADMNHLPDGVGITPFYRSVVLNHPEIAEFFLESGAEPNKTGAILRKGVSQTSIQTLFHKLMLGEQLLSNEHRMELEKDWVMFSLLAKYGGSLESMCVEKENLPISALVHGANLQFLNRIIELFPDLTNKLYLPFSGSGCTALELITPQLDQLKLPRFGDKNRGQRYENELFRLRSLASGLKELEDKASKNIQQTEGGEIKATKGSSARRPVIVFGSIEEALVGQDKEPSNRVGDL